MMNYQSLMITADYLTPHLREHTHIFIGSSNTWTQKSVEEGHSMSEDTERGLEVRVLQESEVPLIIVLPFSVNATV